MLKHEIIAVWLVLTCYSTSIYLVDPMLGLYAISIGATSLIVSYIYAIHRAVSIISRIPAAHFSSRYGKRIFIVSGLILNLLPQFVYFLASEPTMIFLGKAIQGLSMAFVMPSMLSFVVQDHGDLNAEEAVGYSVTGMALGTVIGPAISSVVINESFHRLFVVSTLFGFSALIVALLYIKAGDKTQSILHRVRSPPNDLVADRYKRMGGKSFRLVLFGRLCISYLWGAVMVYLPLFAVDRLGFWEAHVASLFSVYAVFNLVSRPIAGRFSLNIGEKSVLRLGLVLTTLAAGLYFLSNANLVWLAIGLHGIGNGFYFTASISYSAKCVPRESITMGMAILTLVMEAGIFIGSLVSGNVFLVGDYMLVFFAAMLFSLIGTLALIH